MRKNIEESPSYFRNIDYENKRLDLSEKIVSAQEKKADIARAVLDSESLLEIR